jgi:hypothetical protein
MTKPRKEDQDMEETKRIMERLVKMPHKPHKPKEETKIEKRGKDTKPRAAGDDNQ